MNYQLTQIDLIKLWMSLILQFFLKKNTLKICSKSLSRHQKYRKALNQIINENLAQNHKHKDKYLLLTAEL